MTIDRMDVVLGGNAGGAHTALNQTVADLEALRAKIIEVNTAFKGLRNWAEKTRKKFTELEATSATLAGALGAVTGISNGASQVIINNNQKINNSVNKITNQINRSVDNSTRNITQNISRVDNSVRNTTNNVDRSISRTVNNVRNMANQVSSTSSRMKSGISSIVKSFMGLYAVGKVFAFVKQSMISGMDTIESESLFETSLDNMADSAREWSENLSEQLGLNAIELRKNVGVLYTMTTSMGIADDTAYDVSTNLVKLAEDMASYYNISSEEAFVKIRAGLTGETEPLKAIGILVDEQTTKQYAYAAGIAETGEALTQQQKVLARYTALMAQTGNAQGDLARTMESPANQLRTLKTRFEEMKQTVGAEFQPFLKVLFPALAQMIENLTPHIVQVVRVVSAAAKSIVSLGQPAKNALKISIASAVVLANLTKIYSVYNALKKAAMILAFGEAAANTMDTASTTGSAIAHGLLTKVYKILVPEVITFSSVLKASLGWIGLVAGAFALLYAIFNRNKNKADDEASSFKNLNDSLSGIGDYKINLDSSSLKKTSDSADEASDSIKNLKKEVSLAGFDEINTLSFDTEGEELVNLDTDDVDDYSDALDDLDNQINSMPDIDIEMPDLSEYDLGGLFNFSGLENVKNRFLEWIEETFGIDARNKIDDFFYTLELIPDAAGQMFNDMMNDGGIFNPKSKFWDNWVSGMKDISPAIAKEVDKAREIFSSLMFFLKIEFSGIKSKLSGLKDRWVNFWEDIGSGIHDMKEEWDWWFSEVGKSWKNFWEDRGADFFSWAENLKTQLDMIAEAIKSVFSGDVFSEDFSIAGYFGKIVAGNSSAVRGYATGGFPDYGELFIARENGIPEMVGTMGNSAAVANNMQIVEGISQGVYEAVTSAIQQNSSKDSGNITIPVYLFRGSQEMTRIIAGASQRYESMTGGHI